jgi:hypothetical protein
MRHPAALAISPPFGRNMQHREDETQKKSGAVRA